MTRRSCIAWSLCLALFTATACQPRDRAVNVAPDDPDMVAAIARARETLPQFWQAYETRPRGESDFCLKVKITDQRGAEHFWVVDLERRDGKTLGTINNDPSIVASVKAGDRIEIPEADITDWLFMRAGKMVGNHTVRALFKSMPPDEVARTKIMMESP
jgi:uncharacterized protein YegJ (DUF2314 family)